MTRRSVHTLTASLILTLFSVAFTSAQTIGTFDGGDTPITLETFGDAPGPSIMGPGLDGNFLLLTGPVNGQNNFATFDRSDAGTFATSDFRFDFLIAPDQTPTADGISFSYANTATYGTSGGIGAAAFTPEDPAAEGVLGFGFDTLR